MSNYWWPMEIWGTPKSPPTKSFPQVILFHNRILQIAQPSTNKQNINIIRFTGSSCDSIRKHFNLGITCSTKIRSWTTSLVLITSPACIRACPLLPGGIITLHYNFLYEIPYQPWLKNTFQSYQKSHFDANFLIKYWPTIQSSRLPNWVADFGNIMIFLFFCVANIGNYKEN